MPMWFQEMASHLMWANFGYFPALQLIASGVRAKPSRSTPFSMSKSNTVFLIEGDVIEILRIPVNVTGDSGIDFKALRCGQRLRCKLEGDSNRVTHAELI